ncbi:hypothetical protein FCOIX_6138 [Fusarium coicis]|nr:hypothetical protein FCOIX_6138 [Fusarium coicis]
MDINNMCKRLKPNAISDLTAMGKSLATGQHIIIRLSSGEEIEFPASDFMENHAVPSAGTRNPTLMLRESDEVDDGSLPVDLSPDINVSDMDPPDETLEREEDT